MSLIHSPDTKSLTAEIGHRVRAARMLTGMSQERLGDALGITFQQVQKYEKGTNRIAAATMHRIADVLNVPVMSLMGGEDGPHPMDDLINGESARMLRLFAQVKDKRLRTGVLDLLESMVPRLDA